MEIYDSLLTDSFGPETLERLTATIVVTPESASAVLDEVSARLLARFAGDGTLAKPVPYPGMEPFYASDLARFSVLECCVHCWDMSRALGHDPTFDEGLAQVALDGVLPRIDKIRAAGFVQPPTSDHPSQQTAQGQLLHLVGRET
jgi:hypothetical protein